MATKIVDKFQVSPSPGAPTQQLLKLAHFDISFLPHNPLQNLFFYSFECSESHFLHTVVPNLKNTLSLTLKHFPPLAGKIILPLTSGLPISRYVAGEDSVSLTIAISRANFMNLTGYHFRNSNEFYDFIPHLPPATYSSDSIKFSVTAIQVTLFPNQGISICFNNHHAIGDAATIVRFIQTWASITKFNGDDHLIALGEKCLPFYDRDIIKDANRLATECWDNMKIIRSRPSLSSTFSVPTNDVRATFVLNEAEIQQLKNFVSQNKKRAMAHVSSFVVACAHLWTCLAKSTFIAGENMSDDEPEYLCCAADSRRLLRPPLPDTYFGNCLTIVFAESTNGILKGNDGFLAAAEVIGEAIEKTVSDIKGNIDVSMNSSIECGKRIENGGMLGVVGSPRFDMYGADYGWGRPKKYEPFHQIHRTRSRSVFIYKSREFKGGMEINLSMPKVKMDAFADIFDKGLKEVIKINNIVLFQGNRYNKL